MLDNSSGERKNCNVSVLGRFVYFPYPLPPPMYVLNVMDRTFVRLLVVRAFGQAVRTTVSLL